MDHYRGLTAMDTPTGGGAWVKEHGYGHEVYNFDPVSDEYLGYVRPMGSGINLARLGGSPDVQQLRGVTVVWVATHPTEGGTRVVGWYLNATVFAEYQKPPNLKKRVLPNGTTPWFLVKAHEAVLLDRDERIFEVLRGKGGMGQSNAWYPDAHAATPILEYIGTARRGTSSPSRAEKPRLLSDVHRRLRIEATAMKAAVAWFADRGYEVEDVSMDRLGWDIEARLNRAHLKVEVKGTSAPDEFLVEVTPNEYAQMTSAEHRAAYRLCVVTNCEDSPVVAVFAWSAESETWVSGDGKRHLEIEERVAARISAAR